MSHPRDTETVTILGAGLAGSLLANFLARRGFRVSLYERRPDLRKVDISAGRSINLALANRGIKALEQVGVMDRVRPQLITMAGRMLHDTEGELAFLPYGSREHEVIYSVSRGGLNSLLMDAAEATGKVDIRFGMNCRHVDFARREITFLNETNGGVEVLPYEVAIGADGSASRTRNAIMAATGGRFGVEPLAHSYKELTIPASREGEFLMKEEALHIWPRGDYMLIALPNVDRSFTVTLFLPTKGDAASFEALQTESDVLTFFLTHFPDAEELIPSIEREFFENPTGGLGTVRCHPWHHEDHALVIGDAAHAIVPFHGQGMNCAFEDCSVLDECLDLTALDWTAVFTEFTRRRKPDADAIAAMALENYVEMRDSVRDPRFVLKKEVAFRLEEKYPETFIPRYSMVMFHHIPYAEAMRRGAVNEEILDQLTEGVTDADAVDYELAEILIRDRLED